MPSAKFVSASIKGGGIVSNIPELQEWLKEYVKVRNQTVYQSVFEKMRNIAYKAWQYTRYSDPSNIRSKLSNLPITKESGKRTGNTQYVGLYKLINWERKNKGLEPLGGSRPKIRGKKTLRVRQTKPKAFYMQGKYKSFLAARTRSARWLRLGWMAALKSFGVKETRGQNFGGGESATLDRILGKPYGGGSNIVKIAPGSTEFMIYNGVGVFDHRYNPVRLRPEFDVQRARAEQEYGLNRAIQEEIKDMAKLIIQRTSDIWNGKEVKVKSV
jgi:hypothetical protein